MKLLLNSWEVLLAARQVRNFTALVEEAHYRHILVKLKYMTIWPSGHFQGSEWDRVGVVWNCTMAHFREDRFWTCLLWNLAIAYKRSGYFQKKSHNAIRWHRPGSQAPTRKWPIWTKGFLCTRPFNFICQQIHSFYLLFARMQNFINNKLKWNLMWGGEGGLVAGMPPPPPPLPRSST